MNIKIFIDNVYHMIYNKQKQEERENNSTSEERRTAAKKIESTMICKK